MNEVEIVDADSIRPSTYNPRKADPARLQLVALSLTKLGFILPIYIDANGEILSGHQRHYVATEMLGATKLPVVRLPPMELAERKALNITFNRATNDMDRGDRAATIGDQLKGIDTVKLSESIPNKEVDTPEFLRCQRVSTRPLKEMMELVPRWSSYARNVASALENTFKVRMPVVSSPTRIVNGIGRVQNASERGYEEIEVVDIEENEAEFAGVMLNLLSMDFDIHTRYEEILRFNSFRRAVCRRFYLGRGFIFAMDKKLRSKDLDIRVPEDRERWVKFYGSSIVDFGAGKGEETALMREGGIRVASFEPFHQGPHGDELDREKSIEHTRKFLADIADGRVFSSVFCSSVMNSVPFKRDREHMVTILAALCGRRTRCYGHTKSVAHAGYLGTRGADPQNASDSRRLPFGLSYETGIVLGDFTTLPKVQKFFTPQEFYELFRTGFEVSKVLVDGQDLHCISAKPYPVDPAKLRAALEFEFNLPYPDGERMGLVEEAVAAFEKRLKIAL